MQEPTFRFSQANGFANLPRSVDKVTTMPRPTQKISSPMKIHQKITIAPPKPPSKVFRPPVSNVRVNFPPPKKIEERKDLGEKKKNSPKSIKNVRFMISPAKSDYKAV